MSEPAGVPLVPAAMLHALTVAHAEIARLRDAIRRLAEQDATLSVRGGSVIVEMDATLTEAERGAVERSAAAWEADSRMGLSDGGVAATLRGLLERTE